MEQNKSMEKTHISAVSGFLIKAPMQFIGGTEGIFLINDIRATSTYGP